MRKIILTHIPRTGGSSLFAAVRSQQANAQALEIQTASDLALMKDSELNNVHLISTYLGSRLFDRLDGSWIKVVILRDPIARLKSSYWNLRQTHQNISFASAYAKSLGFREYLSSRDAAVMFQANNVQTWSVFGDRSLSCRASYADVEDGQIVAASVNRLQAYDFIGFTETLDELWTRLCVHCGWIVTPLPRLRVTSGLSLAEEGTSTDLEFHTRLDRELIRATLKLPPFCQET